MRTIDRRHKVEGVHPAVDIGVIDFRFVCYQDDPDAGSPPRCRSTAGWSTPAHRRHPCRDDADSQARGAAAGAPHERPRVSAGMRVTRTACARAGGRVRRTRSGTTGSVANVPVRERRI